MVNHFCDVRYNGKRFASASFTAADRALQLNMDLFLQRKTVCRTRVFEIRINAPTLGSIGAVGAIGIAAGQPMFEDTRIRGANCARIPP